MPSLFRPGTDLMVQFAGDHRDRRNIATHFVGVPLAVFALGVLLARPEVDVAGFGLTPGWALWAVAAAWYLSRGHLVLGAGASAVTAVLVALAQPLGEGTTTAWLAWGAGCLAAGWGVQFLGHVYEGRRAGWRADLAGLLVGPMFLVAEVLFAFGRLRQLAAEIERRVGPTMLRDLHAPATR